MALALYCKADQMKRFDVKSDKAVSISQESSLNSIDKVGQAQETRVAKKYVLLCVRLFFDIICCKCIAENA